MSPKDVIIRKFIEQNVEASHLPQKQGCWEDPKAIGNSRWIIDDQRIISWGKGEYKIDGAELKKMMASKYGVIGVMYKDGEPDFEPFEDKFLGPVEIDFFSSDRKENFKKAIEKVISEKHPGMAPEEVDDYMKKHQLTWHECGDRKTLRAVPQVINAAFPHTGGIGIEKSINSVHEVLQTEHGEYKLHRSSIKGDVSIREIKLAAVRMKRKYKRKKRELMYS